MTRDLPMLARDRVALAVSEGRQTQHRVPVRPQPAGPLTMSDDVDLSDVDRAVVTRTL